MLMRQMRQNTKIIMLVTALAFVALMVFQWGMDVTGRTVSGTLGRVGGRAVSVLEWQNAYRNLYDQRSQSQEQPITTQQNREIEDEAWAQVVDQILIEREMSRRRIRVSDNEIRQAARLSPPPEFQLDPAFQNEQGQFDLVLYQRFLDEAGQDPIFLQQLELYYRSLLPRNKLIRQVTSNVFVPDSELWERWRAQTEEVTVSFLSITPDERVDDASVTVSDEEVERYYRENPEEFEVPARAQVLYSYFEKAPSASDTAAAFERAREIRAEILDGAEFGDVALRESMDPGSRDASGSLGTFGRGMMVPPLDSVAFALPIGELSEPVLTGFGIHLIEVLSRDEEADEADARHILLPIELTDEAEVGLLTRADSLETLAENQPLREAAAAFGLTVREGEIEEEFAVLAGVGDASEAVDWVFVEDDDAGVVSPVFETETVFYLIELLDESPAGTLTLERVTEEIRGNLQTEQKIQLALEEAHTWRDELVSGFLDARGPRGAARPRSPDGRTLHARGVRSGSRPVRPRRRSRLRNAAGRSGRPRDRARPRTPPQGGGEDRGRRSRVGRAAGGATRAGHGGHTAGAPRRVARRASRFYADRRQPGRVLRGGGGTGRAGGPAPDVLLDLRDPTTRDPRARADSPRVMRAWRVGPPHWLVVRRRGSPSEPSPASSCFGRSGAGALATRGGSAGTFSSPSISRIELLNSRIPFPSEDPISGSLFAPNRRSTTRKISMISHIPRPPNMRLSLPGRMKLHP